MNAPDLQSQPPSGPYRLRRCAGRAPHVEEGRRHRAYRADAKGGELLTGAATSWLRASHRTTTRRTRLGEDRGRESRARNEELAHADSLCERIGSGRRAGITPIAHPAHHADIALKDTRRMIRENLVANASRRSYRDGAIPGRGTTPLRGASWNPPLARGGHADDLADLRRTAAGSTTDKEKRAAERPSCSLPPATSASRRGAFHCGGGACAWGKEIRRAARLGEELEATQQRSRRAEALPRAWVRARSAPGPSPSSRECPWIWSLFMRLSGCLINGRDRGARKLSGYGGPYRTIEGHAPAFAPTGAHHVLASGADSSSRASSQCRGKERCNRGLRRRGRWAGSWRGL